MSTALTTLSEQQRELLQQARASSAKPFAPRISEIKLAPANKEVPGVPKGHYYIKEYNPDTKVTTCTDIGRNPRVVILKKAATYSYYSDKSDTLIAWTTDIEGYDETSPVVLFKNGAQGPSVEFKGTYPEFKAYAEQKYTTYNPVEERSEKLLKFSTVLYVLYEDKVYRMFVRNTGVAGLAEGAKSADFKKPQLLSLMHFLDTVNDLSSDQMSAACFESICQLDSKIMTGSGKNGSKTIEFYIMQFKNTGERPDIAHVVDIYGQLLKDLKAMLVNDLQRMSSPGKVSAQVVDVPMIESEFVPELPDL